jgi:hypothetical protein
VLPIPPPIATVVKPEEAEVTVCELAAKTMLETAVALALLTVKPTVAGTVNVLAVLPAVKEMRSTFWIRAVKTTAAAGSVEIVNVSLPAPPSTLEPIKKAAVVETASSKAVVTALAFVFNVVETFALAAVNEMVLPVPCAPKPKSVEAREVTPGK